MKGKIALALTAGSMLLAGAQPAAAGMTVGGTVMCVNQAPVVGVWIQAASGGSGWASWTPSYGGSYYAHFNRWLPYGGSWRATVGCGGTPAVWKSSNTAVSWTGSPTANLSCFPGYTYGFGSYYAANRCFY